MEFLKEILGEELYKQLELNDRAEMVHRSTMSLILLNS